MVDRTADEGYDELKQKRFGFGKHQLFFYPELHNFFSNGNYKNGNYKGNYKVKVKRVLRRARPCETDLRKRA